MKKIKSSYYLPPDLDKEMRIEAAKLGLSYPSEFLTMLWERYVANQQIVFPFTKEDLKK